MDPNVVPVLIPIVAMMIPITAIVGGFWVQAQKSRLIADQRMAMIARGLPLAEIEAALRSPAFSEYGTAPKDPLRSLGNARRAATVLISVGLGIVLFGLVLEQIIHVREVFAIAAAGLVPLVIGAGFVVDYYMQKSELARFGMESPAAALSTPGRVNS
jgi:hypothetical protein